MIRVLAGFLVPIALISLMFGFMTLVDPWDDDPNLPVRALQTEEFKALNSLVQKRKLNIIAIFEAYPAGDRA